MNYIQKHFNTPLIRLSAESEAEPDIQSLSVGEEKKALPPTDPAEANPCSRACADNQLSTRELRFHVPVPEEYDAVQGILARHGEGSCQHSFVTMLTLQEKYGDEICIADGVLYTLRSHLCDDVYRVYLAPLGDGDRVKAFRNVMEDAHRYGKKVKFFTLTPSAVEFLQEHFPELYDYEENRDLAEYFYKTEQMGELPGGRLAKRRKEVHQFWNTYADRATVKPITKADHAEILAFEEQWLAQNTLHHDACSLKREANAIRLQLRHYEALHLSGVVLRVDGAVRGFSYGTPLSNLYYDALVEKADKNLVYPYRVLRVESVKQCAMDYPFVNLEEDLGIEGLRKLKTEYHPEYLLNKFVVTEKS